MANCHLTFGYVREGVIGRRRRGNSEQISTIWAKGGTVEAVYILALAAVLLAVAPVIAKLR